MYSLIGNQWPSNCQKKTISSAANQKAWMHGPDHHQAVNRVSRLYHFNILKKKTSGENEVNRESNSHVHNINPLYSMLMSMIDELQQLVLYVP